MELTLGTFVFRLVSRYLCVKSQRVGQPSLLAHRLTAQLSVERRERRDAADQSLGRNFLFYVRGKNCLKRGVVKS